jgi:hypothetical protein
MAKIRLLFVGLLSLMFLVNTCAAVNFDVTDNLTKYAKPGDTVSFNLRVNLTTDELKYPELFPYIENFSITNPRTNWGYSFSANNLTLDDSNHANTSVLYIKVPLTAYEGAYDHKIELKSYSNDSGTPFYEQNMTIIVNTDIQQVPEFPSIALPVAAVLGLVAIFGRKK